MAERTANVITEVGYQPNPGSPTMTSVTILRADVLILSSHDQIFTDLSAGIESITAGHGYQTLVASYGYDHQREKKQTTVVLAFNARRLLLTEPVHSLWAGKCLNTAEVPIAEVVELAENPGRINVGSDNFQASFSVTTMPLAGGEQRIIYSDLMSNVRDEQHYLGYCRVMEGAGLAVGRTVLNKVSSVSIGTGMMTLMRQIYVDMDGILCINDDLTVGMLQECLAPGISIPRKLAIVGFHDLEIDQIVSLRLAGILMPRFEMKKAAVRILIKKIKRLPTTEKVDLHYRPSMGKTI